MADTGKLGERMHRCEKFGMILHKENQAGLNL